MGLITRSDKKGVDVVIDKAQRILWSALEDFRPDWDLYPRVYLNPSIREGFLTPEHYDDVDDEYAEVLITDLKPLVTFFSVLPDRVQADGKITAEAELYVQCSDLQELFPAVAERSDEHLVDAFLSALSNQTGRGIAVSRVVTGVQTVYGGFNLENLQHSDMNEYNVFKIVLELKYSMNCSCCT